MASVVHRRLAPLLLAATLAAAVTAFAEPLEVRVGATLFPPYIERTAADQPVRVELLELLNAQQDKYRFRVVENSAMRRFAEFDLGKYDVSCFDNLAWGWGERPVEATKVFLGGGEIYVALAKPGRGQSYFDALFGKRMIGVRGYHYGFAKFNAEPKFLEDNFQMVLAQDNEATLRLLLLERGDIAVVTAAYLADWLRRQPEQRARLLISKKLDQSYEHRCIVRRGTRPSAAELDELFEQMQRAGVLTPLWQKYQTPGAS